jgi:hypothetical protein
VKLDAKTSRKKPYQKPSLRLYGDIRAMTQLTPHTGTMRDGVTGIMGAMFKTR